MKPSQPSEKVKFKATASLPVTSTVPVSPPVVDPYWFYEYQWNGPKRHHVPVWEPRQTTFFVVFDGEARRLFSTARILFYCSKASKDKVLPNAWDIQQVGSMIHTSRGGIDDTSPNDASLPMLTVAFEVVTGGKSSNSPFGTVVLRSPTACFQHLRQDSIHILLEREHSLTPHTLSLSVSFTHSTMLYTVLAPGCRDYFCAIHRISEIEYITTRIVRVLPPSSVRPRVTNACLPTELLLKIFGDNELCSARHDDLLSFAQVCRAWSCSMEVLHSRLSFSDGPMQEDSKTLSRHMLDTFALAKALTEKPVLGAGFQHLTTNILRNPEDMCETPDPVSESSSISLFTSALIAILRATKNIQHLHLAQLDASQADALLTAFHDLRDMRTFSLGALQGGLGRRSFKRRSLDRPASTLNVSQLSRCMAKWPALKSLKVHHLHPSTLGLRRYTLRTPSCALTQLTIARSRVSDKDLMHLFGASARTLERVTLDRVDGLTNAGLLAFLLAVSRNITTLTLLDVALPPVRQWGNLVIGRAERALDVVVDKLPRLRQLVISGDVASEFMLDRRSKMYLNGLDSEETRVPVVQLWSEDVPRLCGFEADWKWPGWNTPDRSPRR